MNDSQMVLKMFANLTQSDRKSICASRGFERDISTMSSMFTDAFLSKDGLPEVMETLSAEDSRMLNLLLFCRPVGVSFFASLYSGQDADKQWGTYNELYRPVFKKVKKSLISKGVLIMTIAPKSYDSRSVLERHKFSIPVRFEPWVPLPFGEIHMAKDPGECMHEAVREKVRALVTDAAEQPSDTKETDAYDDTKKTIKCKWFTVSKLRNVLYHEWDKVFTRATRRYTDGVTTSLSRTLFGILSRLKDNQWVACNEIEPFLEVLCRRVDKPDAVQVCDRGLQCGLLARLCTAGKMYYRPAAPDISPDEDPSLWLRSNANDGCTLDIGKTPLEGLELIAAISNIEIRNGKLTVTPDIPTIGHASASLHEQSLIRWLDREITPYRDAFATVRKRAGKTVLHKNLMIARVGDFSLKMKIIKIFSRESSKIVELPGEYIAFPINEFNTVCKVVSKAGFAVKTIEEKYS